MLPHSQCVRAACTPELPTVLCIWAPLLADFSQQKSILSPPELHLRGSARASMCHAQPGCSSPHPLLASTTLPGGC
eukprot:1148532-Pelagomonas_calceolata.AAC.1